MYFIIFFLVAFLSGVFPGRACWAQKGGVQFHGVFVGMPSAAFFKLYPRKDERAYRGKEPDEWLTFNNPLHGAVNGLVTFHLQDGKIVQWRFNDRKEVATEYLAEFSPFRPPSKIYTAIHDVLQKMPYQDFLRVTGRRHPIIFTEFYDSGTARFASSSEFFMEKNEPACCQDGFTLIKLGMGLNAAKTPAPIEAVVAHEIAHRVLGTIRKGHINCDAERAANHLIQKWGFKTEFRKASQEFGQKKGYPVACQEADHRHK